MGFIHKLSQDSSRLLSSSNIITSVFSVVKELIENSLDSGATNIEVRLVNNGLDKIEVRDNGVGIKPEDILFVAKPHFTSKLNSILDLEKLETYGFRGEALNSICAVGQLIITTITATQEISQTYIFDKNGDVQNTKPSASLSGTTVSVVDLFENIPVRKKYYKSAHHKRDEIKKIEDLIYAYSCAQIETRFALFNNQSLIWSKTATSDMKVTLIEVFGSSVASVLEEKSKDCGSQLKVKAFLPMKFDTTLHTFRNTTDRTFVIINKRPVKVKAIDKLLQETFCQYLDDVRCRNKYPTCVLLLTLPISQVDVNVDPNKSRVLLHNFDELLALLKDFLQNPSDTSVSCNATKNPSLSATLVKKNTLLNLSKPVLLGDNQSLKSALSLEKKNPTLDPYLSPPTTIGSKQNLNGEKNNQKNSSSRGQPVMQQTKLLSSFRNYDQRHDIEEQTSKEPTTQTSMPACALQLKQRKLSEINSSNSDSMVISYGPLFQKQNSSVINRNVPSFQDITGNSSNIASLPINTDFTSARKLLLSKSVQNQELSTSNAAHCKNVSSSKSSLNPVFQHNQFTDISKDLVEDHFLPTIPSNFVLPEMRQVAPSNHETSEPIGARENDDPNAEQRLIQSKDLDSFPSEVGDGNWKLQQGMPNTNDMPSLQMNSNKELIIPFNNELSQPQKKLCTELVWSRGNITDSSAEKLQPVSILVPNQGNKRLCDSPGLQQKKSKVNSPLAVGKTKTAFDIFCQQKRLEVAAQNPTFGNREIGQLLFNEWKALSSEKQQIYEKALKNQQKRCGKVNVSVPAKKEKKFRDKPKETIVSFDICRLSKQNSIKCPNECVANGHLVYVANMSSGVSICSEDNKLMLFNSYRMREAVIFQQLLERHHLECSHLPEPILLSPQVLGDNKCYETLLLLCMKEKNSALTNECLLGNGFRIEFFEDECIVKVIGMTSLIPSYGLQDLNEVLRMISSDLPSSTNTPLSKCRPFKVTLYLQSEAVRMVRQSLPLRTKSEFLDLLNLVQTHIPGSCKCFHNRPFTRVLFDLNNIKLTYQ